MTNPVRGDESLHVVDALGERKAKVRFTEAARLSVRLVRRFKYHGQELVHLGSIVATASAKESGGVRPLLVAPDLVEAQHSERIEP